MTVYLYVQLNYNVQSIYFVLFKNRELTPQARKVAGLSRPGVSKVKKKKKNPRGGGDSNS